MRSTSLLALAGLLAVLVLTPACRSVDGSSEGAALRAIREADVVHAGESHVELAHHAYQLRMLKVMTEQARLDGVPMLLGMEMFQRPFQGHLDDYVAGTISEREMLRRTEYYERWVYDHTMYAPLWQYCREHGVRVVALNAERDLVRAVSRGGGVEALSPEQRAQLADEIDLSNEAHRSRIMAAFQDGAHPMPEEALQGMYEAMTVWDETMAESAADALTAAGPGARMLVIAGSQHVQEYTGIPDRVSRRLPGKSRAVVVLRTLGQEDESDPSDSELGDVVVRLRPVAAEPPSRLGVMIANDPLPEGLLITSIGEASNAARARLQQGDILQWIDDSRITDMVDLRYTLDRTPIGATVTVRFLRDGAPASPQLTFAPPPPPPPPTPEG